MALHKDTIPANIRDAARRAGLRMPHGYVGRNNGRYAPRQKHTVDSVIATVIARTKPSTSDDEPAKET